MVISTLDLLYFVLILFSTIIGTLLTLVLIRALAILWVIREITNYYYKVKKIVKMYSQVPEEIKSSLVDLAKSKKKTK